MRLTGLAFALVSSVVLACGGSTSSPPPSAEAGVASEPQALVVNEIAMLQTVKVSLMTDGARVDARNAPVIAGREGIVRVMFRPQKGWVKKKIRAVLEVTSGGVATKYESADDFDFISSTDDDIDSSLNFHLPKEVVTVDSTYNVTVSADGGETYARFPTEGSDSFGAVKSGGLKVRIVPVRYQADGSGRLPDVGADMLDTYKSYLYAMYPVTDVTIDVRDPYEFTDAVGGDGSGWDTLLNSIVSLRADDKAPDDVYYYGLFVPNSSFYKYCDRGCVAGLSGLISSPADAHGRASIGLGYSNEESAMTMAHEIGHAHGRPHAPCGNPAGIDKKFPYEGGTVGVYGWNMIDQKLVEPWFTDVMGYCTPVWISDYTYRALFDRVSVVDKTMAIVGATGGRYRVLAIDGKGNVVGNRPVTLARAPISEARALTLTLEGGRTKPGAGSFVPYDHLPGGMLFVRESDAASIQHVDFAP
ncbi:MAG: hypothetical protein ACXVEF_30495 [Polyangiales bacterium]